MMNLWSYPKKVFFLLLLYICLATKVSSQCKSEIGTLSIIEGGYFDNNSYICYGNSVKVEVNYFEAADSQELYYILHLNKRFDPDSIELIRTQMVGEFYYPSRVRNNQDEFFITAKEVNIFPDIQNDSCIVHSNTLKITFLQPISLYIDVCHDRSFIDISGGLPEKSLWI